LEGEERKTGKKKGDAGGKEKAFVIQKREGGTPSHRFG